MWPRGSPAYRSRVLPAFVGLLICLYASHYVRRDQPLRRSPLSWRTGVQESGRWITPPLSKRRTPGCLLSPTPWDSHLHTAPNRRLPYPQFSPARWMNFATPNRVAEATQVTLEEAIAGIRRHASVIPQGTALRISGLSRWLGMNSRWEQTCSADGAVMVTIDSPDVSVAWGYDGRNGAAGAVWEKDFNGLPSTLDLDEKEVRLLMLWAANSQWATEGLIDSLDVRLAGRGEMPEEWKFWHHPTPLSNPYAVPDDPGLVTLSVGLKGGRIRGMLTYNRDTWELQSLSLPSSGVLKHIRYDGWFSVAKGIKYPREVQDTDEGGMTNIFTTKSGKLLKGSKMPNPEFYHTPDIPLLPQDTVYDTKISPQIKAYRARSNHILVQPTINGKRYNVSMMLDTGASGLCISREFADQIGLAKFGEVVIQGATQVITSQFRRADTLQLGPVTIKNPVFMELSLRGIVRAAPTPVVGILGYDAYRRMVLELPVVSENPWTQSEFDIVVHNPATYEPSVGDIDNWMEVVMQGRTPLAKTRISFDDGSHSDIRFMLDSGAGGMNIVFHERAKDELTLKKRTNVTRSSSITGISAQNGTSGSLGVSSIKLNSVGLAPKANFHNLTAYVPERGGLDISMHMAGILCNDLLLQCRAVYDYPHNRLLLVKDDQDLEST